MKTIRLYNLFEEARREKAPRVDVTAGVLARIDAVQHVAAMEPYRPLIWMLTGSGALAAAIAVAAVLVWQSGSDSVSTITEMISWAI